jgi:murein hydrolase activator
MHKTKFIVFIFLLFTISGFSQSIDELKKQREQTEKEIAFTNKLLETTRKDAQVTVNNVAVIGRQIVNRESLIMGISKEVNLIDVDIIEKTNHINNLENQLAQLKSEYEKVIFQTWKTRNVYNRLMFVFSGKDLGEIYRRLRYLREFASFRKQQGIILVSMKNELQQNLYSLESSKKSKIVLLDSKTEEKFKLEREKQKQDAYVKQLKQKEVSLKKQLAEHQKKRNELNKFIEKIIAEEIRKANEGKDKAQKGKFLLTPEEQLVSDQFDKNKGKLPWPVDQGIIISRYGIHIHEVEKNVKVDNPGIDIQSVPGTKVRSVFNGVVSGIYSLPNYNMGITIRHGEYISFYANLEEVYVKKGDVVSVKQDIGKIFSENDNKTILHFQIWKGQIKNNPEIWIAK